MRISDWSSDVCSSDLCKLEPLLADLEALYANRGVNLAKRGGRWAFRTAEDLGPRMELENKVVRKLSRVALETLAVIAYHQPVTRAEIDRKSTRLDSSH